MSYKKAVAIGLAGEGKSTILNRVGGGPLFDECSEEDGGTKATSVKRGKFYGLDVELVDTPGLDDQEGEDAAHIQEMVNKVKALGEVHCILLVFNANSSRFTQSLKRIIKVYMKIFNNPKIWDHFCFIFTRCYPSVRSKLETDAKKEKYINWVKAIYMECFSLNPVSKPPCLFVDSKDDTDLKNKSLFIELNQLLQVLNPISCGDMQKADTVYSKITHQNKTEIVKSEQVYCGTRQKQTGSYEVSRGGLEGFFGGTRDVPIYTTETIYKQVDTWIDKTREVRTMYDGKVVYGDWVILKTYTKDH